MCVKKKSHIPVNRMTRWIRVLATISKQLGLRLFFLRPLHQILCPNLLKHASSRDKNNDWGRGLGQRLVSLPAKKRPPRFSYLDIARPRATVAAWTRWVATVSLFCLSAPHCSYPWLRYLLRPLMRGTSVVTYLSPNSEYIRSREDASRHWEDTVSGPLSHDSRHRPAQSPKVRGRSGS